MESVKYIADRELPYMTPPPWIRQFKMSKVPWSEKLPRTVVMASTILQITFMLGGYLFTTAANSR